MTAEEFYEKYVNEDNDNEWGECYPDTGEITLMTSDEETSHKTCYTTSVYKYVPTEEFFEVTWTRDNSGYWSDGERYPGTVRKVKPVTSVVTVTNYVSCPD